MLLNSVFHNSILILIDIDFKLSLLMKFIKSLNFSLIFKYYYLSFKLSYIIIPKYLYDATKGYSLYDY